MTEKKKKEKGFFKKMLADIQAYLEEDGGEVTAELTLQDSNATDIVFPDLESGDTPKVGDKATVDGSAIPDGSYVMPSLEDATVVFVDGAISEIIPKEDATSTETVAEKNKGKGKKKAEVKAEEVLTITTWKMNVVNTSFAEGDTVTYIDWDDNEQTLSNSEFVLSDGRSVVTDAAGVIVKIKEANSPEQVAADNTTETQANFEELLEKMTEKVTKKVTDEIKADFEAELEKKDKEITSLKKGKSSKEIIAEEKENLAKDNKEKGAARYLSAANNL